MALMKGEYEALQIRLVASKVTGLDQARADLLFFFEVHNPNAFALTTYDLAFRVMVQDDVLAEGRAAEDVVLPAEAATQVELPVHVEMETLARLAATGLMLGEIPYRLEATFDVGSLLFQRKIDVVESGSLVLNLPLGLTMRPAQPATTRHS